MSDITVITIGTKGNQRLPIDSTDVSKQHASLTVRDDMTMILEDLHSTNGTYVNLHKIVKKRVNLDTVVRLGNKVVFKVSQLLEPSLVELIKSKEAEAIKKEFLELEPIWNEYYAKKSEIEKNKNKSNWIMRLPLILTAISTCITRLCKGDVYITIIVSAVTLVLSLAVALYLDKKNEKIRNKAIEDMNELDEEFKTQYLCPNPKCRTFLGVLPFSSLSNTGHCNRCGCDFI